MNEEKTTLGEAYSWGSAYSGASTVGLTNEDKTRHQYIIGQTGTGKTTLQQHIVMQAILAGQGVCFIDPHGDAVEEIAAHIPPERTQDVIWFSPSEMEYPIAWNLFDGIEQDQCPVVAAGMTEAYMHIWGLDPAFATNINSILSNSIAALLEYGQGTMTSIPRMLADRDYRKRVLLGVKNHQVLAYWLDEFNQYPERMRLEITNSTLNKVRRGLVYPAFQNIVGQRKNKLDIRAVMNDGKVLLCDLSKGNMGKEAVNILGGLIVNEIYQQLLRRQNTAPGARRLFTLVVDEFQNFGSTVYADMLSETRKYNLALVLGHQYVKQVDEEIVNAIFGNSGTMTAFRLGVKDAQEYQDVFGCTAADLIGLEKYHAMIRRIEDGEAMHPVVMKTNPFDYERFELLGEIRDNTRALYCTPREDVEKLIAKDIGRDVREELNAGTYRKRKDARVGRKPESSRD